MSDVSERRPQIKMYLLNMRTYASVNNNNNSITLNDVQSRIYIGVHKLVYEN